MPNDELDFIGIRPDMCGEDTYPESVPAWNPYRARKHAGVMYRLQFANVKEFTFGVTPVPAMMGPSFAWDGLFGEPGAFGSVITRVFFRASAVTWRFFVGCVTIASKRMVGVMSLCVL